MKKSMIKLMSLACALSLLLPAMTACNKPAKSGDGQSDSAKKAATTQATPAAPTKLILFTPDGGRLFKDDNPFIQEIEKRTNVKLEITTAPNGEYLNKYSVIVASGSIPDITRMYDFHYFQYVTQGIFMDLAPLLDKNAPNIKKACPDQKDWDYVKYKGKQTAIPYVNVPGKLPLVVRQDWLDNLGLKAPTTLDEFTEVARKFTLNDPDKNGKNDTYALGGNGEPEVYMQAFSMIFGAYGIQPQQYYIKDSKVRAASISDEYKAALEYLAQLYKEKIIDPDYFITKADQGNQKIAQGRIGFSNYWWSTVPQQAMSRLKMEQIVPGVKWTVIDTIKGKNGQSGQRSYGTINGSVSISSQCKAPEAALKFLDYLATREGWELSRYGFKNEHYTEPGKLTEAGTKAMNEKWLDPLSQMINVVDWVNEVTAKNDPANWAYVEPAAKAKLYTDDLYGITTTEYGTLWPEVKKVEIDWFAKFVTGAEPISKFDEYVKQWKAKGGQQLLEAQTKEYNNRTGKSVTVQN